MTEADSDYATTDADGVAVGTGMGLTETIDTRSRSSSFRERLGAHGQEVNEEQLRQDSTLEEDFLYQTNGDSSELQQHDGDTGGSQGGHIRLSDGDAAKENRHPRWTDLKTKAGKERKRLPLACIACRRKKIRCSGEKPACNHCFRSRIPCVYKVTPRKAAPRTDYMAMLDKRLKRMEERVIKIIPKDDSRDMPAIGRAVVKPGLSAQTPRSPRALRKKRAAAEAFSAEMNSWLDGLPSSVDRSSSLSWQPQLKEENRLLTEGAEFLPPMEIQEHLSEVFFDCVYGQSYLLLHKPSFMRILKSGSAPPVLTLAICAVSARFSTHPQLNSEPAFLRGENWANPAAAIALSRHDQPNITILTVFLILGLHEFGACHGGRSWSFGGQALRMAYALQLHRELDRDPHGTDGHSTTNGKLSELSFTDREIRRRTMWACILMDRYNSSGSQRPPIGNEKFLHIQLPIKESLFQLEIAGPTEVLDGSVPNSADNSIRHVSNPKDNMGASAYIVRGITLWGRIVDYLNLGGKQKDPHPLWAPDSGYATLKRQLADFAASLPSSLVFTLENLENHAAEKIANQFLFLHIIIHQNILFLNRFAIPLSPGGRPPKDMPKPFLSDAGRAAVEAAGHISMLIQQASIYLLTVPFAGYCAYTASTVHIWGIFSKNAQLEATSRENLRHAYGYLNKMKRYWGMFHYMVESAKERYRQFADAAARGRVAPPAEPDGAQLLFQYGDWFDKYPHGVSRLHWEDPDTNVKVETGGDAVMSHHPDLQSVEEFFASLSPPSRGTDAHNPQKEAKRHRGPTMNRSHRPRPVIVQNRNSSNRHHGLNSQNIQNQLPSPQQHATSMMNVQMNTSTDAIPAVTAETTAPFTNLHGRTLFGQAPTSPSSFHESWPYDFSFASETLPELDQKLVYGAYAGLDPLTTLKPITTDMSYINPPPNNNNESALDSGSPGGSATRWNVHSYDATLGGSGSLLRDFPQPSGWFLPFNLEPMGHGVDVDATEASQSAEILGSTSFVTNDGINYNSVGSLFGTYP